MDIKEGTHYLGQCEDGDGYYCEDCRIEYSSRWQDMTEQDDRDAKYFKNDY